MEKYNENNSGVPPIDGSDLEPSGTVPGASSHDGPVEGEVWLPLKYLADKYKLDDTTVAVVVDGIVAEEGAEALRRGLHDARARLFPEEGDNATHETAGQQPIKGPEPSE